MAKKRTQQLEARASAKQFKAPLTGGADALSMMSGLLARDLASPYIEAKFQGTAARCPIAPSASTAVVHDRKRVPLNYAPLLSTGEEDTDNLTMVIPSAERVVATTSASTAYVLAAAASGPGLSIPVNQIFTDNTTVISLMPAACTHSRSHMLYPYNGDSNELAPGYQIFDDDVLNPLGVDQFNYTVRGFLEPNVDLSPGRQFTVEIQHLGSDGVILNSGVSVGFVQPGEYFNLPVFVPYVAGTEYVSVKLLPQFSQNFVADLSGTVSLAWRPYNTGVGSNTDWVNPLVARYLECHDLDAAGQVQSNNMVVRTLTSLFSFDGPKITQGGFVAISEIKGNEAVRATDLVDYLGSRPKSHYGKIVEGAYGVYVEDSIEEFALKPKVEPFIGGTKYILCASRVSDSSQSLNLVLSLEAGIEFVTNSRVYEQHVAVPAMYPAMLFAIMQELPRFSSNDDHIRTVVKPAQRLSAEARGSAKKSTPKWKKIISGIWDVAAAVGPALLPLLMAA